MAGPTASPRATTARPPHVVRPVAVLQRWRTLSFLHWAADPAVVGELLPHGLVPDVWAGSAWVGVTPFSTTCEVLGRTPLPGPGRFPETNVRTYVRAPDGSTGIWFFSLDVPNRANVVLGRTGGVPYHESDATIEVTSPRDGTVRYVGNRRADPSARYDISVTPGAPAVHDDFESYLVDRWCAFVDRGPLLLRVDVEHAPWPLRHATVHRVAETLTRAAGLGALCGEPVAHFGGDVDARLSRPHVVRNWTLCRSNR